MWNFASGTDSGGPDSPVRRGNQANNGARHRRAWFSGQARACFIARRARADRGYSRDLVLLPARLASLGPSLAQRRRAVVLLGGEGARSPLSSAPASRRASEPTPSRRASETTPPRRLGLPPDRGARRAFQDGDAAGLWKSRLLVRRSRAAHAGGAARSAERADRRAHRRRARARPGLVEARTRTCGERSRETTSRMRAPRA